MGPCLRRAIFTIVTGVAVCFMLMKTWVDSADGLWVLASQQLQYAATAALDLAQSSNSTLWDQGSDKAEPPLKKQGNIVEGMTSSTTGGIRVPTRNEFPSEVSPQVSNTSSSQGTIPPSCHISIGAGHEGRHTDMGLPVSNGMQPAWLLNDDRLVVGSGIPSNSGFRILLVLTLIMDQGNNIWGQGRSQNLQRPLWLRACLVTNLLHLARHGHTMIIRWKPTLQLSEFYVGICHQRRIGNCAAQFDREMLNWEKEKGLLDYLESQEGFTHVFAMDSDAAFVHQQHDTLDLMAKALQQAGKDLFLADEDWLMSGKGRINGGLVFAKNTNFTRALFRDMLDAHHKGAIATSGSGLGRVSCGGNEQQCLNSLKGKSVFASKTLVMSGKVWNRGGCVLLTCGRGGGASDPSMKRLGLGDPSVEIMHFMGGSKPIAVSALCKGNAHYTKGWPDGYACAPNFKQGSR